MPHSNPFIKEMMTKMCQLINHIECRRWYCNIPSPIGQPHNMRVLQIRIPPKPFLQSSMIDRIIHRARKKMQLHRHTIQRSLQMLQSDIIPKFKPLSSILHDPLPTGIYPNINISWSTGIRIRIHQGIPLTFQNTTPHPVHSQHREELTRHSIHLHILPANLLRLTHPVHQ